MSEPLFWWQIDNSLACEGNLIEAIIAIGEAESAGRAGRIGSFITKGFFNKKKVRQALYETLLRNSVFMFTSPWGRSYPGCQFQTAFRTALFFKCSEYDYLL